MEETKKPISLEKTVKIVASENYNKQNIFIYFALNLILTVAITILGPTEPITPQNIKENLNPFIISSIIALIGGLWLSGVGLISYNNAIKRQKGVIPNSFTNIGKYYTTSIKYGLGVVFNVFLISLITFLIAIPLSSITENIVLIICILLIPCLFLTMIFLGTIFNFYTTLNFSDLFDYVKGYKFMTDASGLFWGIFWRSSFLIITSFFGIMITSTILGIIMAPMILTQGKLAFQSVGILNGILGGAVGCILQIYLIELTAQFVRAVLKKQQRNEVQE